MIKKYITTIIYDLALTMPMLLYYMGHNNILLKYWVLYIIPLVLIFEIVVFWLGNQLLMRCIIDDRFFNMFIGNKDMQKFKNSEKFFSNNKFSIYDIFSDVIVFTLFVVCGNILSALLFICFYITKNQLKHTICKLVFYRGDKKWQSTL